MDAMNISLPEQVERFRRDVVALSGDDARFGLAVSGGADSLALLLLAHQAFPERIAAATVDHRLRPESATEAAFVARTCADLGVPHTILSADEPIHGNLQAGARALRYRLLGRWAAQARLGPILTGHHADDQAETLLMRLNRGAGLSGLAGIRAATEIEGVPVVRPLLGWRRAELAEIVRAAGIAPVEDPANADPRFDRARLRIALAKADWLDPVALARSAGALVEAEAALDWATERLVEQRLAPVDGGLTLDPSAIPAELRRRLLLHILALLAPAGPPRGEAVQRLLAALEAGETATLAGVKAQGGAIWRFALAPPRSRR
jgi:tRNA(Ile)-lysidine synthase